MVDLTNLEEREPHMTRAIRGLACVFAAVLVVAPDSTAEDSLARARRLNEPRTLTVSLEFNRKDRSALVRAMDALVIFGANAHATGFIVEDGLAMTAYHVVSGKLSDVKKRALGFRPDDELEVKIQVNGCNATAVKVDEQA